MTRPDITDATRDVARHSHNPCESHWVAVEKILAYLSSTRNLGITYKRGSRSSLAAFADADYASKATDGRSISGVAVMLRGAAVCAISRTQICERLSTAEAEHVATAEGVKDGLFVRPSLYFIQPGVAFPINCLRSTRGPSQWQRTP